MNSDAVTSQSVSSKTLRQLGRDEMNLAEFPITLLTDRVPKDQKEAVYQDEIYDERTGLTLTRKLTISAGNHGLTTAIDDEVILAFIQTTKKANNFTNPQVAFSRHALIQSLNWPRTGASYDRLHLSLKRWTSVFLHYENAWRDNKTKSWVSAGFHIIDNYEIADSRTTGDQLDLLPSYIIWNKVIFESFQAGYLKPLDYDLCMGLSNSTAKRMYRFLDKRFHHKPDWTFDLKEFAHEHIGLSRNYDGPAHIKRKLLPAIAELESIGFLEPMTDTERFQKDGKDWRIWLVQGGIIAAPLPVLPAAAPHSEPAPPLVAELAGRGVTRTTAAELVRQYPAEGIEAKLEVFDWLTEKQDKRVARSPAGYLVKSITDDYATPKGFESRAARRARSEAKRQADQKAAEGRLRQREQEARDQARRQAVDAYLQRLTPAERKALEAEALARAGPEARQGYEEASARLRATMLLGLVREHVAQELGRG
jgi:Replication initiator protein A